MIQQKTVTFLGLVVASLGEALSSKEIQEKLDLIVPYEYTWILRALGVILLAIGPSLIRGYGTIVLKDKEVLDEKHTDEIVSERDL